MNILMDSNTYIFLLPIHLVKRIIEYIKDDQSYSNFRITCSSFHDIMPNVKKFYENGILLSSIKFFHGYPLGSFTIYTKDGCLNKSYPLNGYSLEGVVRFYEHFKSYYKCHFIFNKKEGFETYFYKNGNLFIQSYYKSNLKTGKEVIYYPNGYVYSKKDFVNDMINGNAIFLKPDGNLKINSQMVNNMLNGETISYFNNSQPYIICNFKNNIMTGLYRVYYNNGNLKMRYNIYNGNINGIVRVYYHNGKLKDLLKYVDGEKHGIHKHWYINGPLCIVENYKNGVLHGDKFFYDYDNTGKGVIYILKYNMGNIVKYTEVFEKGKTIIMNFIYDKDNKMCGGKFSFSSNYTDIETDFDQNMDISNFIHSIDPFNNEYYKIYKKPNSDVTILKKFSHKSFHYSIIKIGSIYRVFDNNDTTNPQKYYTDNLRTGKEGAFKF